MTGPSRDDDRQASLNSLLDSLPAPQMPEGLAARIVRDVTRLPQITAEAPEPALQPASIVPLPTRPRARWIAWAGGGAGMALAASLAAALLLPSGAPRPPVPAAPQPKDAAPVTAEAGPLAPAPAAPAASIARNDAAPTSAAPVVSGQAAAPPTPATPPANEVADNMPAPPAATAPATPTDSVEADDEAELVDSGNADAPTPLPGTTPAPRGWGYAPGAASPYPRAETPPSIPDGPMGSHRRDKRF